ARRDGGHGRAHRGPGGDRPARRPRRQRPGVAAAGGAAPGCRGCVRDDQLERRDRGAPRARGGVGAPAPRPGALAAHHAWLGPHIPGWFQWFLFSLLSVLSVAFLRGPLLRRIMPVRREGLAVDALVGEVAVPLEDLAPGAVGKAELRGSAWTARNVDARPLARGERSVVTQVDGLVLSLRAQWQT